MSIWNLRACYYKDERPEPDPAQFWLMTDIEKVDAKIQSLQSQIDTAKEEKLELSLRSSCRRLADDESLPIVEIVRTAVTAAKLPLSKDRISEFAEQLACRIDHHAQT